MIGCPTPSSLHSTPPMSTNVSTSCYKLIELALIYKTFSDLQGGKGQKRLTPLPAMSGGDASRSQVHPASLQRLAAQQQQQQLQQDREEEPTVCGFSRSVVLYIFVVLAWSGSFYAATVADHWAPTKPNTGTTVIAILLGTGMGHVILVGTSGKDLSFFIPRWEHFRDSLYTWLLLLFTGLSTGGFLFMSEVVKSGELERETRW